MVASFTWTSLLTLAQCVLMSSLNKSSGIHLGQTADIWMWSIIFPRSMEFNSERDTTQHCLNSLVTAVPVTEEHQWPLPPLGPDDPVWWHCQKQNPNLFLCRRKLFQISSVDMREHRAVIGRDGKSHEGCVEAGKGEVSYADIQSYARQE